MLKIMLVGNGKMGKCVSQAIKESKDMRLEKCIHSFDDKIEGESDCLIDFSSPSAIDKICTYCDNKLVPAVIASTGHNQEQYEKILKLSEKVAVFYSQNMSIGIANIYPIIKKLALSLNECDIDIIEKHHRNKIDCPSGTALLLSKALSQDKCLNVGSLDLSPLNGKRKENQINICSVRAGNIVGEHEIIFNMKNESISIKHTALSREIFAFGALNAVRFVIDKKVGLYNICSL